MRQCEGNTELHHSFRLYNWSLVLRHNISITLELNNKYYYYHYFVKMSSPGPAKRQLRSTDLDIHIKLVGTVEFQIIGNKLPSKRQVLQLLFYHMRYAHLSSQVSARLVVREVLIFWEKAGIPTPVEYQCVVKLIKLYELWQKINKTGKKEYGKHIQDEQGFVDGLDDLFDIAHQNALQMMTIPENIDFLIAQRQKGRVDCLLGIDTILAAREQRKSERMPQEQQRKRKCAEEAQQNGICQLILELTLN